MPRPYASGIVPGDVDEVWRRVRDFNSLPDWHPGIASSEIEPGHSATEVGAVRKLTLADGAVVREQLLVFDEPGHSYTYNILEGPFPIRRYLSTIRLAPVTATGETFVEWWTEYDADASDEADLDKTFAKGVFATGIKGLAGG
ncbi:SRPBCC family protein [Prauserella rugosa]|uniref:Polyketide cyclase/dehydrase/lipid transport protein n=1 Tax=Prauserella rugosa TaxID=43354 RepID=A0A660CA80_9PSEU|nr:SRPBCC family protein [Prauserella rugosa]KID28491.1 Polyketide cyclase / dehydrase and lipid transport [Prauserella sp. Am3]KMS84068.1 polyketide cyclase [Streptomyces regensis]TWH20382.1 polyketide cyclase/dehydrase/lipid transport protein [Prauserella rugosa]